MSSARSRGTVARYGEGKLSSNSQSEADQCPCQLAGEGLRDLGEVWLEKDAPLGPRQLDGAVLRPQQAAGTSTTTQGRLSWWQQRAARWAGIQPPGSATALATNGYATVSLPAAVPGVGKRSKSSCFPWARHGECARVMGRLRVLMFDPSNRVPLYSAELVRALAHRCDVSVAMPPRDGEDELQAGSILETRRIRTVGQTRMTAHQSGWRKALTYGSLWRYVLARAADYDVIHIQWLSMLERTGLEVPMLELLIRKNPNVVYTVHDVVPLHQVGEHVVARFGEVYRRVPALVVHSEYGRKELVKRFGVDPSKVTVVPHGPMFVDIAKAYTRETAPEDHRPKNNVGMIGSLRPYKGVADAVRAFARVAHRTSANLLLAGSIEDSFRHEIVQLATELEIQERITLIPRRLTTVEVVALHQQLAVALFPYHRITQSGALVTALSLGVPAVVYDVGGLAELVIDRRTGRIVKPHDIEGLGDAILDVLSDTRVNYRAECLAFAESLSWEETARRTVEIYERLVSRHEREGL